jgi:uncharacterized membrane protein
MNQLSVKDCLSYGWSTFKLRPKVFILVGAVLLLVSMLARIPEMLAGQFEGGASVAFGIIALLISAGVSFLLSMGKTAFYLRAHDSVSTVEVADLWHPHPFLKFVGASVLAGLATIVGLLLLIVPGIIIGIMVSMTLYIVIERGLGPWSAIKESARITKGNRWNLFLLGLALLGINILGVLALIVGLFVSIPVSTLAVVHAYRTLTSTVQVRPVAPSTI